VEEIQSNFVVFRFEIKIPFYICSLII
jgi:hypothetical protein